MVRLDGIEPTTPAWKAEVLPLNYSRGIAAEHHRAHESVKPGVRDQQKTSPYEEGSCQNFYE